MKINVYRDPRYGRIIHWSSSGGRTVWLCLDDGSMIPAEKRQGDNKPCGFLSFDLGEVVGISQDENRQLIFEGEICNGFEESTFAKEMFYHDNS